MFFLRSPQGAPSENVRKSCGLSEVPDGAFSEIVKNSYGFLAVPPGGPQRKREEILWFS